MDSALVCNPSNSSLLYLRSLLKFSLNNLNEALIEIDQAIEKSEDNISKYYYLRGLMYGSSKNYKNALEDFSITIQLDQKNRKAYLNRAKCYFLLGIKDKAFFDLKKFSELKMNRSELHLWAGHFLINDGAYALATQAYTNSMHIKHKENLLVCRAKSNIMARELNAALDDLEKILEISKNSKAKIDIAALMALKMSSTQNDSESSKNAEGLSKSLENFSFLVTANKDGIIFKIHDLLFYKGLMFFYLNQYGNALEDFQKAFEIKKVFSEFGKDSSFECDSFHELLQEIETEFSHEKNEKKEKNEELFTFHNNSFNIYEYYHNCMILYIKLKKWEHAFEYGNKLLEILPDPLKNGLKLLLKCIEIEKSIKDQKTTSDESLLF